MARPDTTLGLPIKKGLDMDCTHDHARQAAMLTVNDVSRLLKCSARTVYRLSDSGRMLRPVKLGILIRWSKAEKDGAQ